jgi:ABC-2 type transport system ATP-binding protein
MDNGAAVMVRDLRKSYRDVAAVRGIDLEIDRSEVFALLGPNGTGKTTTVEILEGHRAVRCRPGRPRCWPRSRAAAPRR